MKTSIYTDDIDVDYTPRSGGGGGGGGGLRG